jgi:predicted nuclease with TOPRIM domain
MVGPRHRRHRIEMNDEHTRRRLADLRTEYDKGQERLHTLHAEAAQLQQTLLRLEGAIAVLTELLDAPPPAAADAPAPTPPAETAGAPT